ncbi:hypothetical protein QOZ80_8AG0625440 [Eleusine coracana subsp. coracana]|nr:hypothetical protein QOZ80_8AG0625440 [Eleusine coracana subsp. coracana]
MAAVGVEEDPAVQAARILLTLRKRKLLRWPEWVSKDSASAAEVEVSWPLERWPKQRRSGGRLRGDWVAAVDLPKLMVVSAGSDASSSGEERERWRERRPARDELAARRPDLPAYCAAPSGSGASTSADRKARRVEKAATAPAASVSTAPSKEPMKVSSPETPLDFASASASAAGSGASSSGDDGSQQPSKQEAAGSVGGAWSGDEGCSSPDKLARVDAGDGDKAISESKCQTPDDDGKKAVKFEFDLNMLPEDGECPGFC